MNLESHLSTSSQGASPALTSPPHGPGRALLEVVQAFGLSLPGLSANCSPNTQSSRTSRTSASAASKPSSTTLPAWGIQRHGEKSPRALWERPTNGPDFISWLGETGHPFASLMRAGCATAAENPSAKTAASIMQSALAQGHIQKLTGGEFKKKLLALLPTLTCNDAKNNGGASQYRRNTLALNCIAGGPLNPTWCEWLLGYPAGWTALSS